MLKKTKILTICCLILAMVFSSASCTADENGVSGDVDSSGVVSDVSAASKEESSAEAVSGEESSYDSLVSEQASETEDNSEESLDLGESADEKSEEISEATSDDASSEHTDGSEDVSENDNSSVGDDIASLMEKYKDLESMKTLKAIEKKYSEKMSFKMSSKIKVGAFSMEMILTNYMDNTGGEEKALTTVIVNMACEKQQTKILKKGDVSYVIDDAAKTYCISTAEEENENMIEEVLSSNVSVETKNELVEGKIYTVDWFVDKNGQKVGFYTKNGELKYISVTVVQQGTGLDVLFSLEYGDDISGVSFEIPDGYKLVELANF
jgi:hypothetical protein